MKHFGISAALIWLVKITNSFFSKSLLFLVSHTRTMTLEEGAVDANPFRQFSTWFEEAKAVDSFLPNAVIVASGDRSGKPSARVMLLKDFDERGFVFYTNYGSRKARELDGSPRAALVFYWAALVRQVRVEGAVEKISAEESDRYFSTRPRGSQLGAWASKQSEVVPSRADLERKFRDYEREFGGSPVPRPPFWGGYRLKPSRIEFWQGRRDRLHDRVVYDLQPTGEWRIRRLSP